MDSIWTYHMGEWGKREFWQVEVELKPWEEKEERDQFLLKNGFDSSPFMSKGSKHYWYYELFRKENESLWYVDMLINGDDRFPFIIMNPPSLLSFKNEYDHLFVDHHKRNNFVKVHGDKYVHKKDVKLIKLDHWRDSETSKKTNVYLCTEEGKEYKALTCDLGAHWQFLDDEFGID